MSGTWQGYHVLSWEYQLLSQEHQILSHGYQVLSNGNQVLKGSDRQSEVVELSMQYCAQIL